jgi:hypothetical protein
LHVISRAEWLEPLGIGSGNTLIAAAIAMNVALTFSALRLFD